MENINASKKLSNLQILSLDVFVKNGRLLYQRKAMSLKGSRNILIAKKKQSEESSHKESFIDLFALDAKPPITVLGYLRQVAKIEELNNICILKAGILYKRVLEKLPFLKDVNHFELRLLGTCIFITQKELHDEILCPEEVSQILAIPLKQLRNLEIFLISSILEFEITITEEDLKNFNEFLDNIVPFVQNMRHVLNTNKV